MQSAQSHINDIFIRCKLITNMSSTGSYILNVSSCQPFAPHSSRNLICSELASCCHFELMCCILPEIRICNSIHISYVYLALKIILSSPLFPQSFAPSLLPRAPSSTNPLSGIGPTEPIRLNQCLHFQMRLKMQPRPFRLHTENHRNEGKWVHNKRETMCWAHRIIQYIGQSEQSVDYSQETTFASTSTSSGGTLYKMQNLTF